MDLRLLPSVPARARKPLVLLLIVLGALLLRLMNNNPAFYSFWIDEADYANRTIYIITHGGGYDPGLLYDHPPGFFYFQAPFFALLGSGWFVPRGIAVTLGLANVLVFYLIGRAWRGPMLGLLLAALFAFEPILANVNRHSLIENLMLLLLSLSFLAIIRFERSGRKGWFLLAVLLYALALDTKLTAIVFLPPLLAYALSRRIHRSALLPASVLILALALLPVLVPMLSHGVLGFHLRKTWEGGMGYYIGDRFLEFDRFSALVMTLVNLNIGLAPFAALLWSRPELRRPRPLLAWLSRMFRKRPLPFFALVWAISGLLFFSPLTFMTMQYIYTIFVPFALLLGLVLHDIRDYRIRRLRLAIPVVSFAVCILMFTMLGMSATNEAVEHLREDINEGDTIVAADQPVFIYHFPDHEVFGLSADNITGQNATYIIFKTTQYGKLRDNASVAAALDGHYERTLLTHDRKENVNYILFRRVG